MVQMLQAGEAKYDKRAKEALMIDSMPTEKIDALQSPRTLNSHFLFRHLPKEIAQKKTKIIRIDRLVVDGENVRIKQDFLKC